MPVEYQNLTDDALLRSSDIHRPNGPFPGGRSTWWNLVARGEAPQPVRYGRITAWRWGDVKTYLQKIAVGIHKVDAETPPAS